MTIFNFSTLIDGQHLDFDPAADVLKFDLSALSASQVRLTVSGGNLGLTAEGKTVWLDATAIGQLTFEGEAANLKFTDGSASTRSLLVTGDGTTALLPDWYGQTIDLSASTKGNQVWGLGGADEVLGGRGDDLFVGNGALTPLNHVSRAGSTGAPTGTSQATISADGNLVAFSGGWTEFGSVNNNGTDVLVKSISSGSTSNEHRDVDGVRGGSGSGAPVISADGSSLVFHSASILVDGPSSGSLYDIYLAEVGGPGIERVNTGSGGALATNGRSENADLSGDGRYVVFESSTNSWVATNANSTTDIFLKDRETGELTRISTSQNGKDGNGESRYAKVSVDGRFVVFQSEATNLTAGDTNGYSDIFVWDREDGSLKNITESLPGQNLANGSFLPDVAFASGIGGVVVFETAKRLVAEDLANNTDIYAYDLLDGSLTLVSSQADGDGVQGSSSGASVSGDGRFVVFSSSSTTLVPGASDGTSNIYVKDLQTGAIALVSQASGGQANGPSSDAQISLGGEWIVFESGASNLADTDGNGSFPDVFRVSNPLLFDTLAGGAGNDTYVLDRTDRIIEAANGGTDTVQASINYTLGAQLENLTLTGTANRSGTGNGLANVIAGNAGNNVLKGGDGIDTASYEPAGSGVTVSLAITVAQATGFGSDTLTGFENLRGSAFNDRLTGNEGANRLDGRAGNDTLTGGGGNDTYVVDSAADVLVENSGAGRDTVLTSVSWTLQSTMEDITLTGVNNINGGGNSQANVVTGNSGNNLLRGGGDADTLSGGGGNDRLYGEAGSDRLTGGGGNDAFLLSSTAGSDTVTDFSSGVDKVQIQQALMRVGDGDNEVENAVRLAGPGGFASSAELVMITANLGSLSTSAAAAAIGSANSAYAVGRTVLFVVDDGSSSALYLFTAGNADAQVSANELSLLATLQGVASTTLSDYVFVP